jgi:DHA1 family bicyclomycin/chloramphenicol resistance-like MFS transporter
VLVLALLAAISPLATGMYLAAFPAMADDLSTDAAAVQLTMTTFLAGLALGQLLLGPISDRTGRRAPLLVGTATCVVASALCAVAPTVGVLIAARFVQGFAGAAGIVLGRAIVTDRVRGSATARTFSVLMTLGALAPVLAPLLGGALLGPVGWRGVFAVLTGLAVVMLLGALVLLPESLPPARRTGRRAHGGTRASAVLTDREYLGHAAAFVFSYGTLLAYVSASPFVLQVLFGLSPGWYSVVFAANACGLTIASFANARLVGRFGARRLLGIGLGWQLCTVGTLLVLTLTGALGLPAVLVLLWSSVTSLGLVMGNATSLALARTPDGAGTGSAVLGAAQFALAAAVAPLVGLGGDDTAVPMAIAMVATAAVAAVAEWRTRRSVPPRGAQPRRKARIVETTRRWSSSWGRPDTATVPTGPTERTTTGTHPPAAA